MLRRACVCLVMLAVMKLGVGMLIGNAGCEARQNVGVNIAGEQGREGSGNDDAGKDVLCS